MLNGPGGASIIGLGYDVRGNVIKKNGNLFVFDHGNRLRTAQGTDTYRYDAQGRRVRTAGADGLLYEVYSLDGKLLWQRDEPLGLRFQHIYLGGSLVASRRMPIGQTTFSTTYRHTDALGSPIAATDEIGAVLQTTEHEPYGKMLNRSNDNRPGYTGHMMDKATGLVYMQQRYYDPLIPRFLSVDPITAYSNPVGAFNRYSYADNNPYSFVDPDGRAKAAVWIVRRVQGGVEKVARISKERAVELRRQGGQELDIGTNRRQLSHQIENAANSGRARRDVAHDLKDGSGKDIRSGES